MVIRINKRIEVTKIKEKLELPKELQIQIEEFWKNQVKENPHLFNGEVWTVTSFKESPDRIKIEIQKTNYAHYLFDENLVKEYKMMYMEIPEGKRHSYAPMMKGILSITAKEMEEQYRNYKNKLEKIGEDVEFARLHFIKKENAIEELKSLNNPKRPYLEDLIKLDSK